ncbi:FHA domain-containing protein [Rhodopirellula sp. SWK7]|uniref:FHA domain-containing protein n=1 Tax=Rhodopirellula sp. SWK7 TaxID=595460 RepID=UPI0002BF92D2|nr:FHA domain-containing protein [Rhodopirellula sp. SWK7]EMI40742.1 FHA domain containing protein [Rhodopirellula sp. SWK7]
MATSTEPGTSLYETVDLWETTIIDDRRNNVALVLEVSADEFVEPKTIRVGQTMTVGRTSSSDMEIRSDRKMSRTHFSIKCCKTDAKIRDLGSTNGITVNGRRYDEASVYDGDQIVAGTTCFTVRFVPNTKSPGA